MERFFQRMREMSRYEPTPHIVNPRYERGEWAACSCGRFHRLINGVHQTGPILVDGEYVWPEAP